MPFDDSPAREHLRLTPRHYFWIVALFAAVVLVGIVINRVSNGNAPTVQVAASPVTAAKEPVAVVQAGPQWQELTVAQKKILHPLASTWNALGYGHKNKWMALANNYPSRSPEEQAKLQSRMVEWSALTPSDRERARLNFAETKKLSTTTLAAEWAAYQELSAEEKQILGEKRSAKPIGAAVAATTGSNDKLTAVPVTRRTGQLQDTPVSAKPQIDPNTLLPKAIASTPSTQAGTTAESQAPLDTERRVPVINIDTLSPN